MFAILYETNSTGFYLGSDINFESAENRFSKIYNDLLKELTNNNSSKSDNFFEMYGIFNISKYCNEYKCYKISTHKNHIIKYKLIFQTINICLYILEINSSFNERFLKRKQNYFYSGESKYLEGKMEIVLN